MGVFRVTFAGHRKIDCFSEVEAHLSELISKLLNTKELVEFYVGYNGDFDRMAISAIREAEKKYETKNSAVVLVLPYKTADTVFFESQFDAVIIPQELHGIYPKRAITLRNRWLVDNSDLIVCYVNEGGGAAATVKYAEKSNRIEVVNIFATDNTVQSCLNDMK